MNKLHEYVCRVDTDEGVKDYITLLSPETMISQGLMPEAIVGELSRPLGPNESITPEIFARNRVFVDFMHKVIGLHAPNQPSCRAEAKRLGNGWIYIIDHRTPTPNDAVPPEDILGALEVKDGQVVPGSYRASPNHRILSTRGFFSLEPGLHQCLVQELSTLKAT